MHPQSKLDKWFMRTKDVLLGIGGVGGISAAFLFCVKYYNLPIEVQAQGAELQAIETKITALHETDMNCATQVALLNQAIQTDKEDRQQLKEWMKSISARLK